MLCRRKLALVLFLVSLTQSAMFAAAANNSKQEPGTVNEVVCPEDLSYDESLGAYEATVVCELIVKLESGGEYIDAGVLKQNSSRMLPFSSRITWRIEGSESAYIETSASSDTYSNESDQVYLTGTLWGIDYGDGERILFNDFRETFLLPLDGNGTEFQGLINCKSTARIIFIPKRIIAKKNAASGAYTFDLNINIEYLTWARPLT